MYTEIEEAIPNQIPILKHNLLYFNIDKFIRNYYDGDYYVICIIQKY